MLIIDQDFAGKDIVLDGVEYERCRFTRCKLIYQGYAATALRDNVIVDCDFALEGAAGLTMKFLVGLADSSDGFLLNFLKALRLDPHRIDKLMANG
jgi:hypothetical protein